MRKALLVGIDHYKNAPLAGCVKDAVRMGDVLCRHENGSPNFNCKRLVSSESTITRASLIEASQSLFDGDPDVALFYFAGHGTYNNLGGYLVTPDAVKYDEGVRMYDVLELANRSNARERIIVLDCCHSGALGQLPVVDNAKALLGQGVSVLSACRDTERAVETDGGGLFTSRVTDALDGGAADVCGKVTVAGVYAYVDEALGEWDQRPLFKSHVSRLVSLRQCKPGVELEVLRLLPGYFKAPDADYPLDPSFEPDANLGNTENQMIFGHLQMYNRARLLVPMGEEHMYFAAMNSKSCKLTALGRFYWHLANSGKL